MRRRIKFFMVVIFIGWTVGVAMEARQRWQHDWEQQHPDDDPCVLSYSPYEYTIYRSLSPSHRAELRSYGDDTDPGVAGNGCFLEHHALQDLINVPAWARDDIFEKQERGY